MQDVGAVHDTSVSFVACPFDGLGVVSITHSVPFHRSASVKAFPAPSSYDPTAVHSVEDVHDTASRTLCVAPLGFGVVCTDQVVPFQFSAKVPPENAASLPTAVQAVDDVHDTASSAPGLGV